MASTNKTQNLNLSQYTATDKPAWLTDYNSDMQTLDAAVAASGVHPAAAGKAGNLHTVRFTGEGDMCKFTATADFEKGDKLKLNDAEIDVLDCDGNEFVAEAWKTGDRVVLAINPTNVRVLSPLMNKVSKGCVCMDLPLREGISALNPENKPKLWTDETGNVTIQGAVVSDTGNFTGSWNILSQIPEGLRSAIDLRCMVTTEGPDSSAIRGSHFVSVSRLGYIQFVTIGGDPNVRAIFLNIQYKVAE